MSLKFFKKEIDKRKVKKEKRIVARQFKESSKGINHKYPS